MVTAADFTIASAAASTAGNPNVSITPTAIGMALAPDKKKLSDINCTWLSTPL
jgi:hypothetical protein